MDWAEPIVPQPIAMENEIPAGAGSKTRGHWQGSDPFTKKDLDFGEVEVRECH